MPWSPEQCPQHVKDCKSHAKCVKWSETANAVLASETKKGTKRKEAEGIALATAAKAIKESLVAESTDKKDYAYAPDDEPSHWKLPIDDAGHVGGAVAALGKGYRGKKVQIPAKDLAAVKAKVRAAWKKFHPGKDAEMPAAIKESADPVALYERLEENCYNTGVKPGIDREKGILAGVKMVGTQSRNKGPKNYSYPPATLAKAVPLYEGIVCNVDHHDPKTRISTRDRLGVFRHVEARADGMFGDLHFRPDREEAKDLFWAAENAPEILGFSHIADGKVNRKDPANPIVEEITVVACVDVVGSPATTHGIYESAEDELPADADQRTFAEHGLSALSDARSTLLGEDSIALKSDRLLEIIGTWRDEMIEGEIADKVALDDKLQALRKVNCSAQDLIWDCLRDDDEQYTTVDAKRVRILAILADWESELKKLSSAASEGTNAKESSEMEWNEITTEGLKEHCPDLYARITGTDELSKLTVEVKGLKESLAAKDTAIAAKEKELGLAQARLAESEAKEALQAKKLAIAEELKAAQFDTADKTLVSEAFLATLDNAVDAAARKVLIEDRKALARARIRESIPGAPPFAPVAGADPAKTGKALMGRLREAN